MTDKKERRFDVEKLWELAFKTGMKEEIENFIAAEINRNVRDALERVKQEGEGVYMPYMREKIDAIIKEYEEG